MDKQLDIRFDRVEKALGTLVDSIAKYNPSTLSAHDFVAADAELAKGLEELQTHQSNYRRLQELRAASASLDAQIKDTLRLLANTRKELVSTPATVFPDEGGSRRYYDINYDELLRYARMISKFTIPPVGAVNSLPTQQIPDAQVGGGAGGGVEVGGGVSGMETAATTPADMSGGRGGGGGVATPSGAVTPNGTQPTPANGTPLPQSQASEPPPSSQLQPSQATTTATGASFNTTATAATTTTTTTSSTDLPEHISGYLNPYAQHEFAPWPLEDSVRAGSLSALAFLADRGVDPEGYDPEEEKARREREEEERRRREERERAEREDRERRMREEHARLRAERERLQRDREQANAEAWRRGSVVAGSASGAAGATGAGAGASSPTSAGSGDKKQFQFMGDLDDDED